MNNYEFNLLSIIHQAGYTWKNGIYLATRIEDDFSVNLYYVSRFYVEVFYDHSENCIEKVKSFKSSKCFDGYLGYIDLDIS
jgi:hypothetical protein